MKQALSWSAIVFVVFTAATGRPAAQSANLNAELLKDWTDQKTMMMKIAEAMPEEKFSFKSTPAQRDYGQQIVHIAAGNVIYLRFFGGKATPPTINRTATAKAEILKGLADSFDYGTAMMKEQTDRPSCRPSDATQIPRSVARARVIYFPHWPHLGHLLSDGGLPASERPRPACEPEAVTSRKH